MIPVLFKKNEQQFRTYGLGEITDIINPKVTRERNGQYLLYFQYPQNAEFSDVFEEDMRIKSDAGVRTKWQTFEISRVVRKEGQLIEVFAKHISQSLLKDALNPSVNIRSSNAQQALRTWNSNRIGDEEFDVWSDISTTSSTNWSIRDVSNAFEALAGVQGSILDVWGGEYEFDNKLIRLHKEMGRKSPVPLEYGRNITGLEQDQQDDNVYTSVYPFATYTPEGDNEPKTFTLPEYYVDGKYLEMHNKRKIQVVDFSGEFEHDDIPTESRLRTLAKQYAETNEVGLPHENLKVEYIDLSKTLDYQEFQTMEEVELNDRLPIFYPKFGITNENAKVVVINYDPVKEENISIELGVIGQSFRTVTTGGIGSRLDRVEKQQDATNNYIVNAKGNRIWFETPDENMEHKVGDTWFEKNGPYDRIHVWNGNQWETIIDSEDIDKNAKEIEAAQKEIEETKTKAEQDTAQALEDAKKHADDEVQASKKAFDEQFSLIDEEIEQVQTTANNAINEIEIAVDAAGFTSLSDSLTGIQSIAVESMDLANDLSSQVSGFELTVNGFNQVVNDYEGQVAGFRSDVNGLSSTVASYEDEVAGYATQVSTFENTVDGLQSDITHVDGRINTLSSTVDGTIQRIGDAEGNITQVEANVNGIQETVSDPVNGLVTQVSTLASGLNSVVKNTVVNLLSEEHSKDLKLWNAEGATIGNTTELGTVVNVTKAGQRVYSGNYRIEQGKEYYISLDIHSSPASGEIEIGTYNVNDRKKITVGNTSDRARAIKYKATGSGALSIYFNIVGNYRIQNIYISDKPFAVASGSQFSQLSNNINARVEKGDVINQINISTEGILIDGERTHITGQTTIDNGVIRNAHIYDLHANKITAGTINTARLNATDIVTKGLSANVVTSTHLKSDTALIDKIFATTANIDRLTGKQAFISSIKAIEISADKITAGTLFGNSVTASGINVDTLVGNRTEFVQSGWNNAVGGNVLISGSGIVTTASNGAQGLIQNGVFLSRRPNGSTLGYIGYGQESSSGSPYYTINLSNGAHFRVRNHLGSEKYQTTFHINSSAEYAEFNVNRVHYRKQITVSNHSILAETSDKLVLNGNRSVDMRASNQTIFTVSASNGNGYMRMFNAINMNGYYVTNESDFRLKDEIKNTGLNSLESIKEWNFVDYEWIDPRKPKGAQFGLIAQETPEINIYDELNDIWNINSSKQLMMTSHAVQQLALREENTNLLASKNRTLIEKQQDKIVELEQRIEELESAA